MATKKNKPQTEPKKTQIQIPTSMLPRLALQEAKRVAEALHNVYAGKAASWDDIATAVGVGPKTGAFKYLMYSAQGYGIANKEEDNLYSLSEIGRKIVAPTYEQEDAEGKLKAILTPTLLSKFYSDYDGYPIPLPVHFPNVLESRYGIPRERVGEAIEIIVQNAVFAGILEEATPGGQPTVKLSGARVVREEEKETHFDEEIVEPSIASVVSEKTDWDKLCFYITPIGDEGTEIRKHADMMLKHLLQPVMKEAGFEVIRADKIERSGLITQQIFEHLAKAKLCVADLSFGNENAFYELGVRHVFKLPTIQVIRKGDRIPFDVSQGRTIIVDYSDVYTVIDRFDSARRELSEHVKHIQSSNPQDIRDDNPVHVYLPGLKVTLPK